MAMILTFFTNYFQALRHLIFPMHCLGCHRGLDEGEALLCEGCWEGLPTTEVEAVEGNTVERTFWGKIPVCRGAAYLYFSQGGVVQNLLHQLKYSGRQDVGYALGLRFGHRLRQSGFAGVEVVVSVPLHADKERMRGYNQCKSIADGIAEALRCGVLPNAVKRRIANPSQTRKGRYDRWNNVQGIFSVNTPDALRNKHVLLVDDVLTTGATLEACAHVVLNIPGTTVSIVTLACPSPV
jgi:ComF family protein